MHTNTCTFWTQFEVLLKNSNTNKDKNCTGQLALDRENRPDMILSKLSANYLGAISNIHKIFFNTIPAPWVLILKGGIWLLFGHLLEVLLKSKIISIQIFYGRIFLSFLNEWILYKCIARIPSTIFGIVIVFGITEFDFKKYF